MRSSRPTKREKVSVQGSARRVPVSRSLAAVVGDDVYGVWVAMLGRVGPAGRTHWSASRLWTTRGTEGGTSALGLLQLL